MSVSFRTIADQCDAYDGEVETVNEARKEFWADIRGQLPARDVKALKAAIKARRKRKDDLDGEEAFDARVYEILTEIERGTDVAREDTRAGAARESCDDDCNCYLPHDALTGELIEEPAAPLAAVGDASTSPQEVQACPDASPTNSECTQSPSNRDVSTDGEPSSAAASQGQAAHVGTDSETLASHEGPSEGEGASVLSPPIPPGSTSHQASDERLTKPETDDASEPGAASADNARNAKSSGLVAPIFDDPGPIPAFLDRKLMEARAS